MPPRSTIPFAVTKKRASGEGTLRQRKDGSWEWRTPSGLSVKKSFYAKTQKEVLKKRDRFLKDLEKGIDFRAEKLTLGEYLDWWLEEAVVGSVWWTTYKDHERMVRLHIK